MDATCAVERYCTCHCLRPLLPWEFRSGEILIEEPVPYLCFPKSASLSYDCSTAYRFHWHRALSVQKHTDHISLEWSSVPAIRLGYSTNARGNISFRATRHRFNRSKSLLSLRSRCKDHCPYLGVILTSQKETQNSTKIICIRIGRLFKNAITHFCLSTRVLAWVLMPLG
jgi:hypothetical protein